MLHRTAHGVNGARAGSVVRKAQAARCAVPGGGPGAPGPASLSFRSL